MQFGRAVTCYETSSQIPNPVEEAQRCNGGAGYDGEWPYDVWAQLSPGSKSCVLKVMRRHLVLDCSSQSSPMLRDRDSGSAPGNGKAASRRKP
jgi:hypothetical protein